MNIVELDTANRHQVRDFLRLPFEVYQNLPQWVPPMDSDARRVLNRERNPYFQHSEAAFFLAYEGSQPIGRVAILDNRRYNEFNHEQTAFFYLFECQDNREAALALFEKGFAWARGRSLDKITGPRGFTPFDGLGLLSRGFEHRPAFGLPYNPAYYPALVEAAGFRCTDEIVSGYLNASMEFPEKIHRAAELIQKRRGLRVSNFRTRKDLRAFIPKLQSLYNAALSGTTGNVPLTDDEVKSLASQILWFANPTLIKIIYKGEQPVGYLFAYPDISEAMQRTRGRLLPLGWLRMLRELKCTRWVNINGAAILEQYRGLGGTAILFSEMQKSVIEGGYQHADLVQIGVENENMQRELADLGIDFYKTHRMYARAL